MQVVLLENVKSVGKKLDVVNVSEGYARNFLIPRGLAKPASNKALSEAAGQKSAIEFKKKTAKEEAEAIKAKLESDTFNFKLKAKNGKFFGSVTSKELAEDILKKTSIEIDKKKIEFEMAIKSPGTYTAKAKLYEGVTAEVKVKVEEE